MLEYHGTSAGSLDYLHDILTVLHPSRINSRVNDEYGIQVLSRVSNLQLHNDFRTLHLFELHIVCALTFNRTESLFFPCQVTRAKAHPSWSLPLGISVIPVRSGRYVCAEGLIGVPQSQHL